MHHTSVPAQLVVALQNVFSKIFHTYPTCVGSVTRLNWLSYHYLSGRNSSCDDFLNSCSVELRSSCMYKQFLIRVIFGVNLVVELNHIEVYQVSHLIVDGLISSMSIVLIFEVRSLGCMSDDVIWEFFSEDFCESNKPSLSSSTFHGFVILPI